MREGEQDVLFLQKKNQKNSCLRWDLAPASPTPSVNKSFLLLFFKKEALPLLLAFALALTLSACGRKGQPSPPGPATDVTYPHVYPSD
jgi:hypothetical protein